MGCSQHYSVIVIGGGHAGTEAALAPMTIFNKAKLAKLLMTIFNKKMSTKLIIKKSPIKIELFGLIK
jgi:tRNA U34 5-carboxymethylaminomethyl modifying enzyme MnmG/GidA